MNVGVLGGGQLGQMLALAGYPLGLEFHFLGGFGANVGAILEPGTYMVRLTAGGKTLTSSVIVLEDIWMRPQ